MPTGSQFDTAVQFFPLVQSDDNGFSITNKSIDEAINMCLFWYGFDSIKM